MLMSKIWGTVEEIFRVEKMNIYLEWYKDRMEVAL